MARCAGEIAQRFQRGNRVAHGSPSYPPHVSRSHISSEKRSFVARAEPRHVPSIRARRQGSEPPGEPGLYVRRLVMTKHAVTTLPYSGRPAGTVVMQVLARGFDHVLVWQDRLR